MSSHLRGKINHCFGNLRESAAAAKTALRELKEVLIRAWEIFPKKDAKDRNVSASFFDFMPKPIYGS